MTLLSCVLLLQFGTTIALAQAPQHSEPSRVGEQPEEVVRRLYHEVVARHPLGIPNGEDRKHITPYLSKRLISRLDTASACEKDYFRLHPDPHSKPQIDWLEFGLFSGAWEEALPAAFHLERTQRGKDGSFSVYLRLAYKETWATYGRAPNPEGTFRWHIAVVVVPENGHFVVDDVIYLKDEVDPQEVNPPLSQTLAIGCDGSRWVGYSEEDAR